MQTFLLIVIKNIEIIRFLLYNKQRKRFKKEIKKYEKSTIYIKHRRSLNRIITA